MAEIPHAIGSGRIDEFDPVKQAAKDVGISASTLKRWLTEKKVQNVTWGRDSRKWIYVKKSDIPKLKAHKNNVSING